MHEQASIITADDLENVASPFANRFFIGHKREQEFLCRLVNSNRLHHALLFEGVQGIGKATLALHFAHSLFKHNTIPFAIEAPMLESALWRQMGQAIYPDFLYITRRYDGKLKRFKNYIAAEDIEPVARMLRHSVGDSGRRIVLIDNIGDLNTNSANALLKMLEEPPSNTLFILISHSHKPVLATIKSRCLQLRFSPLMLAQLETALKNCLVNPDTPGNPDNSETPDKTILMQSEGSVRKAAMIYLAQNSKVYNGLEQLLAGNQLNISLMQQLAEQITAKESATQYQQSIEKLLYIIAKKAKEMAKTASLQKANGLCLLWRDLYIDFHATNLYNLNKKQFLCNFIIRTFNAVHKS